MAAVNALLTGIKGLGPMRLAAMGAVALGTLALLALLILRGSNAPMALLYADLDQREAGQIVDQLDRAHIANQVSQDGTRIMVPSGDVARARLLLAKNGLPSGGSLGYEIFDRGDGLTATQFQQHINETRALEGELVRSIRMISGVRAARVHLVLPRREPFARDAQTAQASVLLTMTGAARMDTEGVQAIVNLIAAAVPGLRPQNIAIIDNRGTVLARAGEPVGAAGAAATAEELRHATELRLSRAVEEMLERSLGPGHVRAEASVEMNFDQTKEVQESYNPDGQVIRSQQSVTDTSKTTEAQKTVTVQNNLPNADAGTTPAGSQSQRQEETTNYEISKTVRTIVNSEPQIRRINLAVMVDGEWAPDKDGKPVWHPRSADEIARITSLVQTAIGYDAKRGDHVEVASMKFAGDAVSMEAAPRRLLGLALDKADLMRLGQMLVFGVIAVLALLLVLRPMALRLSGPARLAGASAAGGIATLGASPPDGSTLLGAGRRLPSASFAGNVPPLLEDESMVSVANIEWQMRASSIRKIAELTEKHPDETISIVRRWMLQGSAE
jgi:flagellar M-ring protein FliF